MHGLNLPEQVGEKLAETGWNRFSAYDVFLIAVQDRLACQIGYADGVSYETASKIVTNNNMALLDAFKSGIKSKIRGRKVIRTKPDDIWLGYMGDISYQGQTGGANTSIYGGNLVDIAEGASSSRASFMRLYVVNASFVLREVLQRADQLKIIFS
jgi:hypothetical protein